MAWNYDTNHLVSFSVNGPGAVDQSDAYHLEGTDIPVTATPNTHSHFTGWTGDGTNHIISGDADSTNITVDAGSPFNLEATFGTNDYQFIVNNPQGTSSTNTYDAYTIVTSSADPVTNGNTRYINPEWTANNADTNGNTSGSSPFVGELLGDTTVDWNYLTQHLLTVGSDGNGLVSPTNQWVSEGGDVEVSASPNAHYHFEGWQGDTNALDDANSPTTTVDVSSPVDLTGTFAINEYTLQVTNPHGASGTQTNDALSSVTNSADTVVDDGLTRYTLDNWELLNHSDTNGLTTGTNSSVAISPTNDASLAWNYNTNHFADFDTQGNGTVNLPDGYHLEGTDLEATATPGTHNHFTGWTGNGTNNIIAGDVDSTNITVDVSNPLELIATFGLNQYDLVVNNPHGESSTNSYDAFTVVTNAADQAVTNGATRYLNNGWSSVGGADTNGNTSGNSEFIGEMTNNTTVSWDWLTEHMLTVGSDSNGSSTPDSKWVPKGGEQEVVGTPNQFYHFGEWSGDTGSISSGTVYDANITVVVNEPTDLNASYDPNLASKGTPEEYLADLGYSNNFDQAELADPDSDTMKNWAEYQAGTDPLDIQSFLGLKSVRKEGDSLVLEWDSVDGKVYGVEGSTNLKEGFFPITNGIEGGTYTTTLPENPTFYRIILN